MMADSLQDMVLDKESFRRIADFAYRESGLTLVEEKSSMIQSRLRHRLRDLGMTSFTDYCSHLNSEAGSGERRHLISALTTNVSHFFREKHHFDTLRAEIARLLPSLKRGGRMRIWSAGCSNGQEAVSAAITILEEAPGAADLDIKILATDIDPEVVRFARQGQYPERMMGGVPADVVTRYFDPQTGASGETEFVCKPQIRSMIQFNELNLLSRWPMTRNFDAIFCRNVVIYFDQATQNALWPRYRQIMSPDGVLFLGHSERIADPSAFGFVCTGPTTYRQRTA